MKKPILLVALVVVPLQAFGQLFQMRSVTSAYVWQKQDDAAGTISNHVFGYQGVQLNVARQDITFGTYLLGFNDFAGPVKNSFHLRLHNFYLQARNIAQLGDITLGRQVVFAGVGTGTMDGARATVRLMDSKIKVTAFGGALLPPKQKAELIENVSENYMAGGQVVGEPLPWLRTSLSFLDKSMSQVTYNAIRTDTLANITQRYDLRPTAMKEQLVSADIEAEYEEFASGHVRFDYDTKMAKQSRIELFTRMRPLERLGVTLEYLEREPRVFYNSIFSVFSYSTLKEIEAGAEYGLTSDVTVYGRIGSLSYGDETESRMTFGGNWTYVSGSLSQSLSGESTVSAASFSAGYPLMENTVTPTLLLSYAKYKLAENAPSEGALSVGLGVNYRPERTLSVDGQVQWNQNKILANDLRFLIRVNYFLSHQLGLF